MNILYNLKFSISLKLSNSSLHGNALSPSLIKALTEFCKLNDPTLKQEHHLPRYKGLAVLCILIANFLSRQANVLSISLSTLILLRNSILDYYFMTLQFWIFMVYHIMQDFNLFLGLVMKYFADQLSFRP